MGPDELPATVHRLLRSHWRAEPGFTVPNGRTYPHQWLWDSCFHAVVWAHLGDGDRAVTELGHAFTHQGPDGFVPHLTYWGTPGRHESLWGRPATSTVGQPPMYGHALAELARRAVPVPADLVDAAAAGLRFWLVERDRDGLPAICHPWESGCDDSPRWDGWYPGGHWAPGLGFERKGDWVRALRFGPAGSPVASDAFEVASCAVAALVAFNVAELATVTPPDDPRLADLTGRSVAVAEKLAAQWHADRRTFVDRPSVPDVGPSIADRAVRSPGHPGPALDDRPVRSPYPVAARRDDRSPVPDRAVPGSVAVRTAEALLPVLVLPPGHPIAGDVFDQLLDPAAFGGDCGPAQVHRAEPVFEPDRYWRGPAWPQLSYLFWVAARRHGRSDVAASLARSTVRGAHRSGLAEYWHPDTGEGYGARPQSWTGLAAVMAAPPV